MIRLDLYIAQLTDINQCVGLKVYDFFYGNFRIIRGIENNKIICSRKLNDNEFSKYSMNRLFIINKITEFEEVSLLNLDK